MSRIHGILRSDSTLIPLKKEFGGRSCYVHDRYAMLFNLLLLITHHAL